MWACRTRIATRLARPALTSCRPYLLASNFRYNSSQASQSQLPPKRLSNPNTTTIDGSTYTTDSWFNVPSNITAQVPRRLHLQPDHPISITRQIIESVFPSPTFSYYSTFSPIVTSYQNFDSLGFPPDHPGRAKTDTYYINESTLLRTHTSAHEEDVFRTNNSPGYLISADVYRRDEIDRTHYPIFHQLEGARSWDRTKVPNGDIAAAVWADLEALPTHDVAVEDPNPPFHSGNPLQGEHHSEAEAEAIAAHLKRSLELMVVEIFTRAQEAARRTDPEFKDEPLQVRWVEAYFPFTSPSWELEVYYNGDWLECLGSGVTKQSLYINAAIPHRLGWTFGVGLDRLAMLLFNIPDIRLFWSQDERFLSQFKGVSEDLSKLRRFQPFSKYPGCYKDVSFWLSSSTSAAGGGVKRASAVDFHDNDVMEIVRSVAGDLVEDVKLTDAFTHPKTGKRSLCYRINYRSLERTLTNHETNVLHERIREKLVESFGVELR
ncbi:phenylalanyl-tRNA synthetase [Xylariaceae sp. FL1019]|nr:phenylalanyl-tRNA synthetase [Xylariaceae sp. FL1019]